MSTSSVRRPRPPSALLAVLLLVLLAPASRAASRDLTGRWGLGLEGGWYKLTGGEHDYSNVDQFAGLHLERGLAPEWTLQLAIRYGYTRPGVGTPTDGDVGWSGTTGAPLYTTMVQPLLRLERRFAVSGSVAPFVGIGAGLTRWKVLDKTGQDVGLLPSGSAARGWDANGNEVDLEGTDLTLGLELGVAVALGDSWDLTVGGRLHAMPNNVKDNVGASVLWGPDHVDANTGSAEGFLGVTWWFGSNDRDGDGVPDDRDGCPRTPEDRDGFQDEDGCPDLDNDQDGIADARDACPDQPEDRDGFQDQDGCPDPDNDLDGIIDADDACPDEPEDMDGFQDDDGCPDLDNDQDGVPDDRDRCPDSAPGAVVDANGCEVPMAAPDAAVAPTAGALPVAGQTVVLRDVQFESGSARLTRSSVAAVDKLADALLAHPEVVVEIRGHTDSVGPAELNLDLSERRAAAVRDQLVRRGVAAGRVQAVGYGEEFPIADNATPQGRARNRRVEMFRVE